MGIWPQRLESLFISHAAPESAWGLKEGVWEEFLKGILRTQQQDILLAIMAVIPYNSKSNVVKIGLSCTLWPLHAALLFFFFQTVKATDWKKLLWIIEIFMQQWWGFFLAYYLHKEITSYGRAVQREESSNTMELNLRSFNGGMELRRKRKSVDFSRGAVLIFVQYTNA